MIYDTLTFDVHLSWLKSIEYKIAHLYVIVEASTLATSLANKTAQ